MFDFSSLRLNPKLDPRAYADRFRRDGVVQIHGLFDDETAERLQVLLERHVPWRLALSNPMNTALTRAQIDALGQEALSRQMSTVMQDAGRGFAYLYLCYPMIKAYLAGDDPGHPLHRLTEFLNTPEFRDFGRAVIGAPGVTKVDAHATLYRPGDFLTLHDDRAEGERRAAYTLGFTRGWRPDWGGQLLFHGDDGEIERGFAPGFNVLTLFKVPRSHSVAAVAPYATSPRLSVTGWLRDDPPVGKGAA
jgi:SM-20-related protein